MPNKIEIVVSGTNKDAKAAIAAAAAETKKLGDAATAASKQTAELGGSLKKVLTSDLIQSVGQSASQLLGSVTRAAGGLSSSLGGTQAVFGDLSDEVGDFAKTASESVGLSEREFREMTTLVGGQLKRMTGDVNLAADASIQLTQVAADLATTYGGTTREAMDSFAAALRGEADPAERFNLDLKITAVNAKAVEMGLADSTAAVDNNARAQALLALILEQSADAQGAFAGSAENASVAQQKATAAIEDAEAKIGQALLPTLAKAADTAASLAHGFSSLPGPGQAAIGIVGALAAGFLILVPRIVAAKTALNNMSAGARSFVTRAGGLVAVIGTIITLMAALKEETVGSRVETSKLAEDLDRFNRTGRVTGELWDLFGENAEFFHEKLDDATSAIGRADDGFSQFIESIGLGISSVEDARDRFKALDQGLAEMVEQGASGEIIIRRLAEAYGLTDAELARLLTVLPKFQEAQRRANERALDGVEAGHEAASAWSDASHELSTYTDLLRAQTDPLFAFVAAQRDVADAQIAVNDAEEEFGRNSPQWKRAQFGLAEAQITLGGAAASAASSADRDLIPALRQMATDGLISRDAFRLLKSMIRASGREAQRWDGTRTRFYEEHIRRTVYTSSGQPVTQGFQPGQFNASGGIIGATPPQPAQGGGPRGGLTLVGEQGPEVVELPYGSRVIPAGQSAQMITGGQPARVVVEVVPRSGASSELMDVLVRELSFRVRTDAGGDVQEFFAGGGL